MINRLINNIIINMYIEGTCRLNKHEIILPEMIAVMMTRNFAKR